MRQKSSWIKRCAFLAVMGVALLFLTACAFSGSTQEDDNTLWVVTEISNPDGMNMQAELVALRMEEAYPGLTVNIEVLPTDEEERAIRLKKIRTQVMSGNGPDVYLLPTGSELKADQSYKLEVRYTVEPLFLDVAQSMRNGVFLDISEYYDADTELNTAALKQEIMDAGCLEGSRFVLPLRFQMPVVYTRPDLCAEYGITEEMLESDFLTLAASVLALEDAQTAAIGLQLPDSAEILGPLLDYSSSEVLVSQEEFAAYLELYQNRQAVAAQSTQEFYDKWDLNRRLTWFNEQYIRFAHLSENDYTDELWDWAFSYEWPNRGEFRHAYFNILREYIWNFYHWSVGDIPLYTGNLSDILETIGVTQLTKQEIEIYPLRDAEGAVQASVTYWGAVGVGASDPELAYAFLRQFLEEEFQWDIYRPRADTSFLSVFDDSLRQVDGQIEYSYPVRTEGCMEYLWDNLTYQISGLWAGSIPLIAQNRDNVSRKEITNADVPELDWAIDRVYFPISVDEDSTLATALETLSKDSAADIDALAKTVWRALWWQVGEG